MLTIITDSMIISFNLRTFEKEKELKELLINYAIDQINKKIRIGFRHTANNMRVGELILKTKDVRKVDFEENKFYKDFKYYSIKERIKACKY